MKVKEKTNVFVVVFASAEELKAAFIAEEERIGIFVASRRAVAVGERVVLRLGIQGQSPRVPLRATVTWRRVRAGGKNLPQGIFAALDFYERDRLNGIVQYFSLSEKLRERREYERLPLLVSARYQTAQGEYTSTTRDLSRGGAFLHCQGPLLQVGTRFPLRLYLQELDGKELELEAEVAWVDVFQAGKGMGVAFVARSTAWRQLGRTLKKLEKSYSGA